MSAKITSVAPRSIAARLGLEPGDELLSINGQPVKDLIDYRFLIADEELEVRVNTRAGERVLAVEKHPDEDLGIGFDDPTFGTLRECTQHCVFCFVDQLPPGLRRTVQIKDDDYRLSFLQGNFVTLTNLTREDLDRIVRLRLSPLYVSVHATDPYTRERLFRSRTHRFGLDNLRFLVKHGIELHAQIVLCPGINGGKQLDRTVRDLLSYYPGVRSVAVVPVGLTGHRQGLRPLKPVGAKEAAFLVEWVRSWHRETLRRFGTRFVFLADEIYLTAGAEFPWIEEYEDFPQVENGVGLCVPFFAELRRELAARRRLPDAAKTILVTGEAAAGLFDTALREAYDGVRPRVLAVKNCLFGGYVTVAGLLGGSDVIRELSEVGGEFRRAILPRVALNDEMHFLDDVSVSDVAQRTGLVIQVADTPQALVRLLAGKPK